MNVCVDPEVIALATFFNLDLECHCVRDFPAHLKKGNAFGV